MDTFNIFNDEKKTAFFLGLSQKLLLLLDDDENKSIAEKSVNCCWEWLTKRSYNGDFLYELLVNEENGITVIAEMFEDSRSCSIWNCLINAVAYTSQKAYENEGARYYPEPIEIVNDDLIYHFLQCYSLCVPKDNYIERISDFLSNCDENDKSEWLNQFLRML